MACKRAPVLEVTRPHPIGLVAPTDFELGQWSPMRCEALVSDEAFSLYCFDFQSKAALFVETEDAVALEGTPFYYQAQAERAVAVGSLPFEQFHFLAAKVPRRNVIWVHSVGRCGSTLMSKILATLPDVRSLSEPDDLTQLLHIDRSLVPPLMASSVRWRGKGDKPNLALKTRSEVILLAETIADLFPDAKHLFLYRNGVDWMNTIYRAWPDDRDFNDKDLNRQMAERWAETVPLIREYSDLNPVGIRMMAWISCMEGFLQLRSRGLDTLAVRYEDLTTKPLQLIANVLEFLDLPTPDWRAIEEVLSKDSQAGTIYDREQRYKSQRQLTPELRRQIYDLVATRPLLGTPDMIL